MNPDDKAKCPELRGEAPSWRPGLVEQEERAELTDSCSLLSCSAVKL